MANLQKLIVVLGTGMVLLFLAGCAGTSASDPQAPRTAANGEVFNDADVEFATRMIPHHAQALSMVDLTAGRHLSPAVDQLAEDIRAAQGSEVEQMVDWLTHWDKPIPETMRDHVNAEHDTSGADEIAELEKAPDQQFEELWLQLMVEHHESAINMARDEQESGEFESATELAELIESAQLAQIEQMRQLQSS